MTKQTKQIAAFFVKSSPELHSVLMQCLGYLSGDLSHDNRAKAKEILRSLIQTEAEPDVANQAVEVNECQNTKTPLRFVCYVCGSTDCNGLECNE